MLEKLPWHMNHQYIRVKRGVEVDQEPLWGTIHLARDQYVPSENVIELQYRLGLAYLWWDLLTFCLGIRSSTSTVITPQKVDLAEQAHPMAILFRCQGYGWDQPKFSCLY